MTRLFVFWASHRAELAGLLAQHVLLVAASTLIAVAIGVPLGIFASRRPRLSAPIVGIANIVQTIPSLAMFGFLLPVPFVGGVGARAAIVVLILYGLLPIVRTTITGIAGIDRTVREAGVAMGMTGRELLDRKSTRLNSSHLVISYAVFCLKKNNATTAAVTAATPSTAAAPVLAG